MVICSFIQMQGAKGEVRSHKDEIRKTPPFDFHFLAVVSVSKHTLFSCFSPRFADLTMKTLNPDSKVCFVIRLQ